MTRKFAVIGHPIGHTMSPFIHKELFKLQNIEVQYSVFDIHPDNLSTEIHNTLGELQGFNITIPHKETIIPLLDSIDESALKYNAVNCVLRKNNKLYGCSTDAFGFTKALENDEISLSGNVLVLGSGGAARTLAREAADRGCHVTLAVRESGINKAEHLKKWLCDNGGTADICTLDKIQGEYDLLINATPVGMYPNPDVCPVTEQQLKCCKAVFDAVYNPEKTLLLKMADRNNIKTVGGMSMLVWQAVKAHEFWYDAEFDPREIEKIITRANLEMERIFYAK